MMAQILDNDKIKELPHDFAVLINYKADNYMDSFKILEYLHHDGIWLSFARPSHNVSDMMEKKKHDVKRLHFIDCVSKSIESPFEMENCTYANFDLREVARSIDEAARKVPGKGFLVVDSLHHILHVHDEKDVLAFLDFLNKRAKIWNLNLILLADMRKVGWKVRNKLGDICDRGFKV